MKKKRVESVMMAFERTQVSKEERKMRAEGSAAFLENALPVNQ